MEHHRNAGVRGGDGRMLVDSLAGGWGDETGEATQERGLAGSGLAQERDDFAVMQFEADVVEHGEWCAVRSCERLGDVIGREDRRSASVMGAWS